MNCIPQIINLEDGTKCVSLEDYDKLATEHMLVVNKLCNERDDFRDVLSSISLYLSVGIGDETTTAKQYYERILEGIKMLTDPIMENWKQAEKEKNNLIDMFDMQTKIVVDLETRLMKSENETKSSRELNLILHKLNTDEILKTRKLEGELLKQKIINES